MAYTGSTGRPGKNGTTDTHTHTHTHTYTERERERERERGTKTSCAALIRRQRSQFFQEHARRRTHMHARTHSARSFKAMSGRQCPVPAHHFVQGWRIEHTDDGACTLLLNVKGLCNVSCCVG